MLLDIVFHFEEVKLGIGKFKENFIIFLNFFLLIIPTRLTELVLVLGTHVVGTDMFSCNVLCERKKKKNITL